MSKKYFEACAPHSVDMFPCKVTRVHHLYFFSLDEVQKKFAGAKGISSDQMFGTGQVKVYIFSKDTINLYVNDLCEDLLLHNLGERWSMT